MGVTRRLAVAAAIVAATPAAAHDTGGAGHQIAWTWDPWITLPLGLTGFLFTVGWTRLRRRASSTEQKLPLRASLFATGWLVLAGALVSPLHALGEHSFAAHMFEHELLMLAAAPLLVLSRPLAILIWAFPNTMRRGLGAAAGTAPIGRIWALLSAPLTATLLQAAALWLWHAPSLFDLALASEGWHAAQHLSFLVSALFFWTAMLARATPKGVAVLCLFATSLVSAALGALMALAASPWYARYAALGLAPFGLSPLEDQQFAGLLMWVPGGMVHAGVALLLLHAMLRTGPEPSHAG